MNNNNTLMRCNVSKKSFFNGLMAATLSVVTIFSSFPSIAKIGDNTWHTARIKQIYPQASGAFVLILDSDHANCNSQSSPDYYYVSPNMNGMTVEGSNKLFSVAMLAASLNKPIQIYFRDIASLCVINRLVVTM